MYHAAQPLKSYRPPIKKYHTDTIIESKTPTIWGIMPSQLHDRFWSSHGIRPFRFGEEVEHLEEATLYLLIPSHRLVTFEIKSVLKTMKRSRSRVALISLTSAHSRDDQERILIGDEQQFVRLQRVYHSDDQACTKILMTSELYIAEAWQRLLNPDVDLGWLHDVMREPRVVEISLPGRAYDTGVMSELRQCVCDLSVIWERPDTTLPLIHERAPGVWADRDTWIDPDVPLIGPIWIGFGRKLEDTAIGPAVLWDEKGSGPQTSRVAQGVAKMRPPRQRRVLSSTKNSFAYSPQKRVFDIVMALLALGLTAPLYPLIMLAIWLEDGRPFFFAHRREMRDGEFSCLKFRSMIKNAEELKLQHQPENQVDGPQFYIENDPRLTRVGYFLRKTKFDELPQFLNVLAGQMSVVGPRPSPFAENQYCPPWREARLSVLPGITGLWQIKRTRQKGLDFQEWIQYDLEYVENSSWRFDLWILWETVRKSSRELFESVLPWIGNLYGGHPAQHETMARFPDTGYAMTQSAEKEGR